MTTSTTGLTSPRVYHMPRDTTACSKKKTWPIPCYTSRDTNLESLNNRVSALVLKEKTNHCSSCNEVHEHPDSPTKITYMYTHYTFNEPSDPIKWTLTQTFEFTNEEDHSRYQLDNQALDSLNKSLNHSYLPNDEVIYEVLERIVKPQEIPDPFDRSRILNKIARLYTKINALSHAKYTLECALTSARNITDISKRVKALTTISLNYANIGYSMNAIDTLYEAYGNLTISSSLNSSLKTHYFKTIALQFYNLGDQAAAFDVFNQIISLANSLKSPNEKYDCLDKLLDAFIEIQDYQNALKILTYLETLVKMNGSLERLVRLQKRSLFLKRLDQQSF